MYFRASFGPTWLVDDLRFPIGYEAQIYCKPGGQTYTGSLYAGVEPVVKVNVRPVLPSDWGTLEVIAKGNHVVLKVNGITTADYTDVKRLSPRGHIALQQNGPQTIVEFRKVEFKELSPTPPAGDSKTQQVTATDVRPDASRADEGFVPLFNGENLSGWVTPKEKSLFTVEDGEIVGRTTGDLRKNEYLATEKTFGDFVLKAKIKLRNGNSGIQFRSKRDPDGVVSGPQADAAEDQWGLLYEERGRGQLQQHPTRESESPAQGRRLE